ncbi:MAG: NAD-binding protein [Pseudooceanicola nanhaiensis]|uniref:NAD-binding protein n=1 Tax=Pseudooceanicola nanhaiensis TaxID=375761 RepID=UPI004057F6AC
MLIAAAALSFLLGLLGFHSAGVSDPWDVGYLSFQLFFMNFEMEFGGVELQMNPFLQAARFGALITAVWAILKAFFPQVRQNIRRWLRLRGKACAVLLGYGPVGQAIGAALRQRECGIRRVTAVHPAVTPELAARARIDGVLLIEGDPSDPRVLDRVYSGRAQRIYVSDPDDLRAIDAAVAVRRHLSSPGRDIRVVLNDSAVAAQIAEATVAGFLGAPNLRWFSIADESARLLIADARFDRFALESGAGRMHLAIVGCGSQGEAIAVEALLTAWRVGLGPPKITFLDRDPAAIEARMRKRIPAWFAQPDGGAIYQAARPHFEFLPCDAETLDFAHDSNIDGLRTRTSGWVFATGDDALNLRASLALHRAIAARQVDPAPIYVRIPTGHVEDEPDLSANPLGLAHTFGPIDSVIARSPLLAEDPDAVPKILHEEYLKAEYQMFARQSQAWENLSETKREANRALFRHAVMKIEDFNAVVATGPNGVPSTYPGLAEMLRRIDEELRYDRIDRGSKVQEWLKDESSLSEDDLNTALLIRDAAICEHNRWTTERALSQFIPTARPDLSLRDDVRRHHNNMHDWFELGEAETRRYDLVMLRALLAQRIEKKQILHKKARVRRVFLSLDGEAGTCVAHVTGTEALEGDVSELRLHLNGRTSPSNPTACVSAIMTCLAPHIDSSIRIPPVRVCFDFSNQPKAPLLALANLVVDELRQQLPETTLIEGFWNWRSLKNPVLGVVGHRDISAFGGFESVTERLRQVFMDLVSQRGCENMLTGYAPGTDRAAVHAWGSLGMPKPKLVLPFDGYDETGNRCFYSDEPAHATFGTTISETEARQIGHVVLPRNGIGHRAQSDELLELADVMVFVVDESKAVIKGGTVETLRRAEKMGKEIVILAPPNRWNMEIIGAALS